MTNKTVLAIGVLIAVSSFGMVSRPCFAATVAAGNKSALPGQRGVSVPVSLSSGVAEEVSAGQFDISFSSAVVSVWDVTAGAAATSASKDVNFSTIEPGRIRVIFAGLNQNVIADGVIANVLFDIASGASGGEQPLTLSGVLLSDPNGIAVPSAAVSGSIDIAAVVPTGMNGLRGVILALAAVAAILAAVASARLIRVRMRHR
jgi:hypothetical protein